MPLWKLNPRELEVEMASLQLMIDQWEGTPKPTSQEDKIQTI
jgi:hypothetical protein